MLLRTCAYLFLVSLAASACDRPPAPSTSIDDLRAEIAPKQESWDVRFVVTETGAVDEPSRPRLEIRSEYMATFESPDSTYTLMRGDARAERVAAVFFNEEGGLSATLHADRMILFEKERRFEARGNVVVETPDEKTLESEHLVWYEDTRKVRTPEFVRIVTPRERVQGYNLEADENLETYTLARVTGQVTVEEDED